MIVYVMPESGVYHKNRSCPALNRATRYWPPSAAQVQADGSLMYINDLKSGYVRGRRRPCAVCS
jgi:hypothetical protein